MTHCEVIYCSWLLYARSNVFTTTEEKGAALSPFCDLLISSQDQFCLEIWRKKGKQIFSKIVRASKLTWQRTLRINNAHLDRSRCWQHLQEVSWKKQIKVRVSSQKGKLFKLSTFSFHSSMLKLAKKIKTTICHVWKNCNIRIYCSRPHVHAWIHPSIKLIVF